MRVVVARSATDALGGAAIPVAGTCDARIALLRARAAAGGATGCASRRSASCCSSAATGSSRSHRIDPRAASAVVCATMPLWVGVLGFAYRRAPDGARVVSLVVGFAGVVVLMGGPSLAGNPMHVVLVICSPVLWAAGSCSHVTKDVGGEHATGRPCPADVDGAGTRGCGRRCAGGVASASRRDRRCHLVDGSGLPRCVFGWAGRLPPAYAWLLRNAQTGGRHELRVCESNTRSSDWSRSGEREPLGWTPTSSGCRK